jgi:ankyrin repeat protein
LLLAALQVVAIAWFSPGRGLPLDDAWIHSVVARTFAETGTLGYAPGQHGAAATSYLWAALLAIDFKFLHLGPDRWALLLNGAAALTTGQLLYSILGRARPDDCGETDWKAIAFVTSLFACASPNVLWFTCSGMEAMPLVALALAAIWCACTGRALLGGLAAGALALLRPEATPLGGLLAVYMFRSDRKKAVAMAAPWAVGLAIYVGSNLAKTGQPLPSTLQGRRWLWLEMSSGLSRSDLALDFLDQWGTRLGTYTFDTTAAVIWIFVAIAAYGAIRLARVRSADGVRLLVAWSLFHAAFYALLLPTPGHGGRYQPFTPLLFTAFLPLGAALLLRELARLGGAKLRFAWFGVIGLIPWIALAWPVAASLRWANALAVAHVQATEIGAGNFIATLPPGNVASFDIGGTGYASHRRVLDLGGLSDPKTAALLQSGRISTWLEANQVRWVVLPESYEAVLPTFEEYRTRLHLAENAALELEPIRVFETPYAQWQPAIAATWNAAPKQVVYEVRYTSKPGPREAKPIGPPRAISDPGRLAPKKERRVAEHMLATLAAWDTPVDIRITNEPAPSDGACVIRLGWWGIGVDGCKEIGDPAALKALAYEQTGRYIDVGDFGGALRSLPHVVAQVKRRTDPSFHPSLPPLMMPIPGGAYGPRMGASGFGLVLFMSVLLLGLAIEAAAREGVVSRAFGFLRTRLAPTLLLGLAGCGRADVAAAIPQGRGAVELAIERGGDVQGAPLFEAANAGDAEIVSLLLARGASASAEAPDGTGPLHLAARRGHAAVLEVLIAAGAKVDGPAGPRARTALQDAAATGSTDAVRVLLRAGADPNTKDSFGQTALHLIATLDPQRSVAITKMLLEAGADLKLQDARSFTPLHAAASTDNAFFIQTVREAESFADVLAERTLAGETPLAVAIHYQRDRAAEALLEAGAQVPDKAMPPLHEAARMDAVARAAGLLSGPVALDRKHDGKTAFDVAVESGSKRVEALLRAQPRARPR